MSVAKKCDLCGHLIRVDEGTKNIEVRTRKKSLFTNEYYERLDFHQKCWDELKAKMKEVEEE